MFSDDEEEQDAAAAEVPTAADLLQQLSRFDDSDAEGEALAAVALPSSGLPASQGQLQKAPRKPPALEPGLSNGQCDKHEQQLQDDHEKKHQKQLHQYNQLQPLKTVRDDASDGEQPLVVHTEELDRFGEDSEEVLQDVDSEEEDSQATGPLDNSIVNQAASVVVSPCILGARCVAGVTLDVGDLLPDAQNCIGLLQHM
eukprot:gene6452-6681_t